MQPFGRRFHMLIAAASLATGLAVPASAAPLPGDEAVGASHLGSYLAGRLARGKNDTRSAVAFYRQALKRDPNNQRIIGHAFLMEATEGNGDQATALARRLVKFDRANRLAQLWIGLAEFKNGNYRAADRHFAAASSGPIGELTASLARSWNAVAAGRSRAALQLLRSQRKADWARFYLGYHRALVADVAGRRGLSAENYAGLFALDSRTPRIAMAYLRHALHAGDFALAGTVLARNLASSGGQLHPSVEVLERAVKAQTKVALLVPTARDGMAEVFYGLGDALTTEGGLSLGAIYLQMALFLNPDFPFARAGIASVYETTQQFGRAIAAYEKIPADSPLRILVDIRKAQNLNHLGKIDEAKAVLIKLLADADKGKLVAKGAGPRPNPVLDQLRAARLPQRVLGVGSSGDGVRDLQNVLKLLGVNAGPVDGWYGRRTRRGVVALQRRLGVSVDGIVGPQTVERMRAQLNASIAAEAADNAAGASDAVTPLKPVARIRIYEALAGMLRARKRYKEAIAYYTKIIELIPEPRKYHWTIWYARGTSYERSNDWASAERDLLKAMELNPDQPLILNYLGYSWVDQGKNLARGLSLISRAVQLKPDDGYVVDSLGWAHYRLGRFDEAVQHLERAVELKPSDPVLNDHLGDALWRAGRQREARFQWELALTLKPEPKVVAEIRKKLLTGLPPVPAQPTLVLPKPEQKAKPIGKRAAKDVERKTR